MRRAAPVGSGIGLGGAVRAALTDFYYQSTRLVPANIAWGLGLMVLLGVAVVAGPPVALALSPLLAIPLAGVVRVAALTVRGRDVVLSDAFTAYRAYAVPSILAAIAFAAAAAVLALNVLVGVSTGGAAGWAFATLAGWGLVAIWVVAIAFWVLLVDPSRQALPTLRKARLAILVAVATPGRLAALGLLMALILVVSTVAFAALVTVSVAYVSLVAARLVLPLADRLEAPPGGEPGPASAE